MEKLKSNKISMKPRWYFVLGSVLTVSGLIGFSLLTVFMTNLTWFLIRRHGPMGQWRLQEMVGSFPIWIPVLAIIGVVSGAWLLKQYDFSYKKNFWVIVSGFILSVVISAFLLDYLGLNDVWSRQGPMRRFYQKIESEVFPNGRKQLQNGQGNGYYRRSQ